MKNLLFLIACTLVLSHAALSQTDIKIRKKTEMKIPGMQGISEAEMAGMPESAKARMKNLLNKESTVYIKGSRMRTDMQVEVQSGYKMEKRTYTNIQQCDKQRVISFNDKKKKYYVNNFDGSSAKTADVSAAKPSAGRGVVTISLNAVDTGERMKLFGYTARHIKQTMTITPGAGSCLKSKMQIEIDGWYADVPGFSCPFKPDTKSFQTDNKCRDEVRYEIKGTPVSGIPLKEIKVMNMDGNAMTITEEVVELTNTPLDIAFFEPPAGYTPANTEAEIEDEKASANPYAPTQQSTANEETTALTLPPTLAPPAAGISEQMPVQPKKAGMIRVGIAPPTAEMGSDFEGGDSVTAVRNTVAVALKTDKVETVFLNSGLLEQEAKQKECDYIFYSKVVRKKGGGGFFKSMAPMIMGAAAGMIPGVGGTIGAAASGVITTATMAGGFKSKDEIGFEYKVLRPDGTTLIAPPATKQKAKKDGDDVLTPQIQQAATAVLSEINKPR